MLLWIWQETSSAVRGPGASTYACTNVCMQLLQCSYIHNYFICLDVEFSANGDKNDSSEGNTLSTKII